MVRLFVFGALGVALVLAVACSPSSPLSPPVVDSASIALSKADFAFPAAVEAVTGHHFTGRYFNKNGRAFEVFVADLTVSISSSLGHYFPLRMRSDDSIAKDLDNATARSFDSYYGWSKARGDYKIVTHDECSNILHIYDPPEQDCEFKHTSSWVLSFRTLEGARQGFKVLAEPLPGVELVVSTNALWEALGEPVDWSRFHAPPFPSLEFPEGILQSEEGEIIAFQAHKIQRLGWSAQGTSARIVGRKGRVVAIVMGDIIDAQRFGENPLDATTYLSLTKLVLDRVSDPAIAE